MTHSICTVKRQSSAYEINRQFCKCFIKGNVDRRGQSPLSTICHLPDLQLFSLLTSSRYICNPQNHFMILYIVSRCVSKYMYNIDIILTSFPHYFEKRPKYIAILRAFHEAHSASPCVRPKICVHSGCFQLQILKLLWIVTTHTLAAHLFTISHCYCFSTVADHFYLV